MEAEVEALQEPWTCSRESVCEQMTRWWLLVDKEGFAQARWLVFASVCRPSLKVVCSVRVWFAGRIGGECQKKPAVDVGGEKVCADSNRSYVDGDGAE